ncbi:MAG: response regulator [Alphaproteobacteria bacterium]|nr:response regulator [Alphaproteobacteria bacterium]
MSCPSREDLIRALPYARRYARALTGSQSTGDHLVEQSLRDVGESALTDEDLRLRLYREVTARFNAAQIDAGIGAELRPVQRQLLLLTALEELGVTDAAAIVGLTPAAAATELADARERVRDTAAADVLIIEDEPIIAMDIEELVRNCGHRVVGVAASETEAVTLAERHRPGLILADINLGAGGDGTSAVARIVRNHQVPVIFVTAYPERLLTGTVVEPAFVITKPFEPMMLAIATYQAVTGGLRLP